VENITKRVQDLRLEMRDVEVSVHALQLFGFALQIFKLLFFGACELGDLYFELLLEHTKGVLGLSFLLLETLVEARGKFFH